MAKKAPTQDVTFAFLDWLRKARKFSGKNLLYNTDRLYDVQVSNFGEDAAFSVTVQSLIEFRGTEVRDTGVHQAKKLTFYSGSQIKQAVLEYRKTAPMGNRILSFPVLDHYKEHPCIQCLGRGLIYCPQCRGESPGTCQVCRGASQIPCIVCKGDRKVLPIKYIRWRWQLEETQADILSQHNDREKVKNIINYLKSARGWIKIDSFTEESLEKINVPVNDRIRSLMDTARREEEWITTVHDRKVKRETRREKVRKYIPLSYLNISVGKDDQQFYLAGKGGKAVTKDPSLKIHPMKAVSMATLPFGLLMMGLAVSTGGIGLFVAGALGLAAAVPGVVKISKEASSKPKVGYTLIFDDDDHDGWLFTYMLSYAFSRFRIGQLVDPAAVQLMQSPEKMGRFSRNSLMFTLEEKSGEDPQRTEIINISSEAQKGKNIKLLALMREAERLIWIAGSEDYKETDKKIADFITYLPPEERETRIVHIIQEDDLIGDPLELFPLTYAALPEKNVRVHNMPLERMYKKITYSDVEEDTLFELRRLLEYSGVQKSRLQLESGE